MHWLGGIRAVGIRLLLPGLSLLFLWLFHSLAHHVVSGRPEYVLRGEALVRAGLFKGPVKDLNLLDDDTIPALAREIEARPGIKRVRYLARMFPAGIRYSLEPRQPWVLIESGSSRGVFDRDRVHLRTPGNQDSGLLHVVGLRGRLPPLGKTPHGAEFDAAFEMAQTVDAHPILRSLVTLIDLSNFRRRRDRAAPEITLHTRSGCEIHWGRASESHARELSVEEKIRNLEVILSRYPGLRGLAYAKVYVRGRPTIRRRARGGSQAVR